MKSIHKKRLQKLIAFLRKLPRKRFNFGLIRVGHDCGTVGCAIGWTPEVFPRHITTGRRGEPEMRGRSSDDIDPFGDIAEFLTGMDGLIADNLFIPNAQQLLHKELPTLGRTATPKQVARMLEKFIKLAEAGELQPA